MLAKTPKKQQSKPNSQTNIYKSASHVPVYRRNYNNSTSRKPDIDIDEDDDHTEPFIQYPRQDSKSRNQQHKLKQRTTSNYSPNSAVSRQRPNRITPSKPTSPERVQQVIRLTMQIEKQEFEIDSLYSINQKLNQEVKHLNQQMQRKNEYINKIEDQLVKKASQIDQKLLRDLEGAESKLKNKDKELRGALEQAKKVQEFRKEYEILKNFVNKAGHNVAKQVIKIENEKYDLQNRLMELEQHLQAELAQKTSSQALKKKAGEMSQQHQKQVENMQFLIQQKQEYCEKLERENLQLKKLVTKRGEQSSSSSPSKIRSVKQQIFRIIHKHHPHLFE